MERRDLGGPGWWGRSAGLRRRRLVVLVDQDGDGACHTGARTCFFRAFGGDEPGCGARDNLPARGWAFHTSSPPDRRPGRDAFRRAFVRGAPASSRCGTSCVADTLTPDERLHSSRRGGKGRVSSSSRSRGVSAGDAIPSWAGGRWPRWWAVGAPSTATGPLELPAEVRACAGDGDPRHRRRHAERPTDLLCSPTCRRCTAASWAIWGTTSCARSSTCPTSPSTTPGFPDAILHVIGQLCAFDHWRQRVVLVDNVVVGEASGVVTPTPTPPWRPVGGVLDGLRRGSFRPLGGGPRLRHPRDDDDVPPAVPKDANMSSKRHSGATVVSVQGAHPSRRHLPGRAVPALRLRPRRRSLRPLPSAATGQPRPVASTSSASPTSPWSGRRPNRWSGFATAW